VHGRLRVGLSPGPRVPVAILARRWHPFVPETGRVLFGGTARLAGRRLLDEEERDGRDALGRGVEYYDMPQVRKIVREAADQDYKLSALIMGVVNSPEFRMRVKQQVTAR